MNKAELPESETEPPSVAEHAAPLQLSLTRSSRVSLFHQQAAIVPLHQESQRTRELRRKHFPHVSLKEWKDWRWQLKNRITTLSELERFFSPTAEERAAFLESAALPFAVTPYYLSLVDAENPSQPIRRSVIPTRAEHELASEEADDPLGEESDSPVPGLVHRYPDRVLFLATSYCSTYCRYCTRSRLVGHGHEGEAGGGTKQWEQCLHYIRQHPQVRDVLISGGDPLTMPEQRLEGLLASLRQIPHVEIIRLGTKVPAVLPQRITRDLVRMLRRYHPLWMSLHFCHPDELTPETMQAMNRLADAGIPLGSQTVLLKGINDSVSTMKALCQGLLRCRVRPYYLYQCDPIRGSRQFRTSVDRGLEIIKGLRGHTTGYAVPTYVIDAPGGGGKIPLLPQNSLGHEGADLLLRNYREGIYRYPDQDIAHGARSCCPEPGGADFPQG